MKEYKNNDYFDKLYGGYTNKDIIEMDLNVSEYEGYSFPAKLVGDEYNGEDCLKVYFRTYNDEYVHVGYAPQEELEEIAEWITKKDIKIEGNLSIVGGKYKYLETYEEDYEEKERVAKEELTYGIEVTLNFYNNEVEPKVQKYQEEHEKAIKSIERSKTIEKIVSALFIIGGIWIFSMIIAFINNLFS